MKFADKFQKMKYLEVDEGFIKGNKEVPCATCGEATLFVDLCSQQPFCSDECIQNFYRQIWEGPDEI